MNRQINYIFSAIGILVAGAGVLFFLKILLVSPTVQTGNDINEDVSSVSYTLSDKAAKGKDLFMRNCASCHGIFKDMTGPSLRAGINKEQWKDRKKLYAWIRNPAAFMENDPYTQQLKKAYGSMMTGFPALTDEEIDAIVEYINSKEQSVAIPIAYSN